MEAYADTLAWIDRQRAVAISRVTDWANVNSGTDNLAGLAALALIVRPAFEALGGTFEEVDLSPVSDVDSDGRVVPRPLGKALRFTRRPDAPRRAFLCIHLDTVYPLGHPFQSVKTIDENTLCGPGVADAKGGLAVMLTALEAFERSPFAKGLGWEVLLNPDEEIGSVGSAPLLVEAAGRNDVGLVFEPTLPDGAMVDRRRGVGNFVLVVRGRSAHAGRDFAAGRNAVVAGARLAVALDALNGSLPGVTVNVGRFTGGTAPNAVPDLAMLRVNVRTSVPQDEHRLHAALRRAVAEVGMADGITAELFGAFTSPPKLVDDTMRNLMRHVEACGAAIGIPVTWSPSGGACDGNKLAAAGLPTVDTLGPRGGELHSPREYLLLDSLTERAKLAALLMMRIASGETAAAPLPRSGRNVTA